MSENQRWIIHMDLDAFFTSVEELLNPELRGKPLIVGGEPGTRAVVASASYAAREYGVRSAMPVGQAVLLCPHLIIAPPHYEEYERRSQAIMDMLPKITPVVEQLSIDEAFLDVTGCERLWGSVTEIGKMIQRRVLEEQQLHVSVGIASNKLVAKIACDYGKPQGFVIVQPGEERTFLAPLPIEKLWGVGKVTGDKLRQLGIETIGDLAAWDEQQLTDTFGDHGKTLFMSARGIDNSPVRVSHERRSISREQTFWHDVGDETVLQRALLRISDHVSRRLRRDHLVAQTVRIKYRYADFTTLTRQVTLEQPVDQAQAIYEHAWRLWKRHWQHGRLVRLIGVGVSGLLDESGYQLTLFDHEDQRRIHLSRPGQDPRQIRRRSDHSRLAPEKPSKRRG